MKFAVTYVMITHLTRRRAGRGKTEIIDTEGNDFYAVHTVDKGHQPKMVEKIFQNMRSTEHSECKVVDVRMVADEVSTDERAIFQNAARMIAAGIDKGDDDTWRYRLSVRMMSLDGGLTPEYRERWKAIPATERQKILMEVR